MVGWVGCVGFPVEGTSACVLVDEAGSCLTGGQVCVLWCVWSVCDLTILGSLSANGWGCVPAFLLVWHRVSSTVACWSLSGAGSWHWDGDLWEIFAVWYYMELGGLWWTNVLNSALPPQRHRPSCGALAYFRLCSRSQFQSSPWDPTSKAWASAPSSHLPRPVSRQASRSGECWSAPILCAAISPLCPLHPCCCALLRGPEASPLHHPQSPPVKGLPSVWKPFLLYSSLPMVQVPSLFFCVRFFFSL